MSLINEAGTCASYEPVQELYNFETDRYEMAASIVTVGISREDALRNSSSSGGRWCCDSCGSASWLQ